MISLEDHAVPAPKTEAMKYVATDNIKQRIANNATATLLAVRDAVVTQSGQLRQVFQFGILHRPVAIWDWVTTVLRAVIAPNGMRDHPQAKIADDDIAHEPFDSALPHGSSNEAPQTLAAGTSRAELATSSKTLQSLEPASKSVAESYVDGGATAANDAGGHCPRHRP